MDFIGRDTEIEYLNRLYKKKDGQLVVIYGRRRVGKSTLVEEFMKNKKHLRFEGLENVRTIGQIEQFAIDMSNQMHIPLLKTVKVNLWQPLFDYLTEFFSQQKERYILFLDEFQWLAANHSKLVSLIKKYWDVHWSKQNVMLILCGSVSSFMVKNVIASKALYGRINWELCLQSFSPLETFQLLDSKRSADEALQYSLVLGGIPKYLKEIDTHRSFDQNINNLFFIQNGLLVNDYKRIFYSQFKEPKTYETIVKLLKDHPLSLEEIASGIKAQSGGSIKYYLDNLEKALFITSYVPYNKKQNSKLKKYKLTDEYLQFYFKYVDPHLDLIISNHRRNLFNQLVKPIWNSWLGFAFENFCLKNAFYLAELMGFADHVVQWGPYFHRGDQQFQIDLIYVRNDRVITLCEIKYSQYPITVSVIHDVEKKCKLIDVPKGYTLEKALISRFGPDESLRELNYFHHFLFEDNFFRELS